MPYALFCSDAKLSNAYPTEADVWKLARKSGLVVDTVSDDDKPAPRPVLDNDYEIRPCRADPQEDPMRNKADAEQEAARGQGVATASEACSAVRATQVLRRCNPLMAPVTLSTCPAGHKAFWTKATS